jgi:lipopolysaccharide/colanic/teichoic acid biosynthesis glycosyltransferase
VRLDELPQLWHVLRGRMSLVGPRPETAANFEAVPPTELARLLEARPGLTGPTQLAFLAEDEVLAEVANPLDVYRDILVPAKVRHDLAWLEQRSLWGDLLVLARTPFTVLSQTARARSRRMVEAILRAH